MYKKPSGLTKTAVLAAAGFALFWLFPRLLPWALPFIIAFAAAAAIEPAVRAMSAGLHMPRAAASGVLTALIIGGAALALALLGGRALVELGELAAMAPSALEGFFGALDGVLASLRGYLEGLPGEAGEYAAAMLDSLPQQAARLAGEASRSALSFVSSIAGKTPRILFFFATTGLGVYFVSSEYPSIINFLSCQIPARLRPGANMLRNDFLKGMEKWLRAQIILAGITFAELAVVLAVLRVRYAVIIAAVAALADFLPVVGAGTVLIPWAAGAVLTGDFRLGAALAVTYGVVTLLRGFMQARLIGDQLGLHPVISLAAVYVGFCAMGVWGMLLLPVLALMVKQLNDRGILKLWKSPGAE